MSFGREGMLREGYTLPGRKQGIARCAIPIVELTGDKPIMPTRSPFVALETLRLWWNSWQKYEASRGKAVANVENWRRFWWSATRSPRRG